MMPKPDLVIGIDSSTSACKAIAWDFQGNSVAEGRSSLPLEKPRPAWHEQQAETWWSAFTQAVRQVTAQVDPSRLAALSISHQRETFVPVNEGDMPLRNAILWMDERAGLLIPALRERFNSEHFHQTTGKPLIGMLTSSKIAWLQENEPEILKRTYKLLDVNAYLVRHLTGNYHTSWASADPTGLFNMTRHQWAEEILMELGIQVAQLPQAFPPGAILGQVTNKAAQECQIPEGLPVVSGLGDGQSAGLGLNITRPGDAYLSLGTSVVTGTFSAEFQVSPAFRTMYGGIPVSYLFETVMLGGTYTIDWFLDKFVAPQGGQDHSRRSLVETLEAKAQQVPIGSEGLVLVPYWNGSMNPYWDGLASGVVVGWRGMHQPQHLYRAILEGIGFELHLQIQGVESALGSPVNRLIATGGGAQSDLWLQIIADITHKPIYRSHTSEAAALGAGILAAAAAGLYPDVRQAAQAMTHAEPYPFEPEHDRSSFYQQLYEEVYRQLFPSLRPYLDRLTALEHHSVSLHAQNSTD